MSSVVEKQTMTKILLTPHSLNQETMSTIRSAKHTAVSTTVKRYNKLVITIVLQLLIRTISTDYIHNDNGP